MIDMSKTEYAAVIHAGNMGGQYLDSLRITDFVKLNQGQYETMIRVIVSDYQNQLSILQAAAKDHPLPF